MPKQLLQSHVYSMHLRGTGASASDRPLLALLNLCFLCQHRLQITHGQQAFISLHTDKIKTTPSSNDPTRAVLISQVNNHTHTQPTLQRQFTGPRLFSIGRL